MVKCLRATSSTFSEFTKQQNSQSQNNSRKPASNRGTMSRSECLEILGLNESAGKTEIIKAHKKLIQQCHPDKGGSEYLAQKINQARDILT